ncbi:MAG: T9SS type A sorting domain-containing protein [Bacteroidales bacterium]|nr:T9SS type A sorting domain-containing protein [Bacteroidales bacterium]
MKTTTMITGFIIIGMQCIGQLINKAEYFIGSDPGFGKAIPITVPKPEENLTLNFKVQTGELPEGFYTLVVRACDELNRWGLSTQQVFYVKKMQSTITTKINKAEYFIDHDPGFGQAESIMVNKPDNNLSLSFFVSTDNLTQGFHTIMVRAQDDLKRWSVLHQQVFYVFKDADGFMVNVTAIEYFIDEDPGTGKGIPVGITAPGSSVTAEFIVNLDNITNGDHVLYLRARDFYNRWGTVYAHAFSVIATGTGNKEIASWLKIYPNPNNGSFNVELPDILQAHYKITICNPGGQAVFSSETQNSNNLMQVDLPSGFYTLTIEDGNQIFTQKLIISK